MKYDAVEDIDYATRYYGDEYEIEDFMNSFDILFKDRLDEIRSKSGDEQDKAVSILADDVMKNHKTILNTKQEMEEFIWSFI